MSEVASLVDALFLRPESEGRSLALLIQQHGEVIAEPKVVFAEMSMGEAVVEDYVAMRLTLRSHPMALLRDVLTPAA